MSRTIQMVLFLLVATLVLSTIHFYIYLRLVRDTGIPFSYRWIPAIFLGIAMLSMPVTMIIARVLSPQVMRWITPGPYYWMAICFLFFSFLVAGDALRLFWWGLEKAKVLPQAWATPELTLWVRRGLSAASLGAALLLTCYGAVHQASGPVTVRHQVRLQGAHPDLDGFRILQLSDLHIGPTLGREWLKGVVDQANAEKPDVIVITGYWGPPVRIGTTGEITRFDLASDTKGRATLPAQ